MDTNKRRNKNNNQKIVEKLIQLLYSLNVNYEMYEFDGHQLKKLNENVDVSSAKFEEYPPYYLTKCGKNGKLLNYFIGYQLENTNIE